jgi:hypothetical protein
MSAVCYGSGKVVKFLKVGRKGINLVLEKIEKTSWVVNIANQ